MVHYIQYIVGCILFTAIVVMYAMYMRLSYRGCLDLQSTTWQVTTGEKIGEPHAAYLYIVLTLCG